MRVAPWRTTECLMLRRTRRGPLLRGYVADSCLWYALEGVAGCWRVECRRGKDKVGDKKRSVAEGDVTRHLASDEKPSVEAPLDLEGCPNLEVETVGGYMRLGIARAKTISSLSSTSTLVVSPTPLTSTRPLHALNFVDNVPCRSFYSSGCRRRCCRSKRRPNGHRAPHRQALLLPNRHREHRPPPSLSPAPPNLLPRSHTKSTPTRESVVLRLVTTSVTRPRRAPTRFVRLVSSTTPMVCFSLFYLSSY